MRPTSGLIAIVYVCTYAPVSLLELTTRGLYVGARDRIWLAWTVVARRVLPLGSP